MKLKKTLLVCTLLVFAIATLSSCKIKSSNTNQNNPQDGGISNTTDETGIWGNGFAPQIVLDPYAVNNLDVQLWLSALYDNCGTLAVLTSDSASEADHEITVGEVNRDIAVKAYKYLDLELGDLNDNSDSEGWLIYSNEKSVSIAYKGHFAFIEAIKYFNENCLTNKSLVVKSGVIASDVFDTDEYVDSIRATRRETELNALVPEIGEETVAALKKMFLLYTDDLYKWLVDLYDPEVGGFYFSNSGRNTESFLPDIESTTQIINFLSNSGLIDEYKRTREYVPKEIGDRILAFAQSLQSSEDGYFYHPQWGKDITMSRRGRDLGWATQLIKLFGGQPLYDTPDGVKGTLGAPGQITATSYLTSKLSISSTVAVSKIMAVSGNTLPAYLKSLDAWAEYIDGLNIPYNSYHAGNTLAAQRGQIELAGQEYIDYIINYLNGHQNPKTALWEAEDSENDEYYALNGLMKLSALYDYFEKSIPNVDIAVETCMSVILKPDGDTHVCSIYNPWITLNYILNSAERSDGEEKVREIRDIVLEKAAELIETTFEKISDYRLEDGGFAYEGSAVAPSNLSQSALVGCATEPESDVNATTISSTGIIVNIFNVLGCTEVKLYDENDYVVFKNRWIELGEIIKEPWKDDVFPVTFDDYNPSYVTVDGGVVIDPDEYVQNNIGDTETEKGNYKWYSSAVVADPAPSHEGDLALRAETFLRPGESKNKAASPSETAFEMQGIIHSKNCFVFDADIYFDRFENYTDVGQIHFKTGVSGGSTALSLNVSKYTANDKTYLCIGENYQGLDGVKDEKVASGIPTGEWVNLRIEVYKIKTDDNLDIKCKVYVNGIYKGTCDAGYVKDGKFADYNISSVNYSHYRYSASVVYFDNVISQAIKKEYVPENDYTGGPREPQKIDYEDYMTYGDTTLLHPSDPTSPNASVGVQSVIGIDQKETLAFVYDSNVGGSDRMRFQAFGSDADDKLKSANAFIFETDIKFDYADGASGSSMTACEILLGSCGTGESYAYRACLYYYANTNEIKIEDVGISGNGKLVSLGVGDNEWFTLRVEYYKISADEMLTLIFVNGNLKYASNNCRYNNNNDDNAWPVYSDAYTTHKGKTLKGVDSIFFLTNSNTDVTMCFDNSILRRIDSKIPDIDINDNTTPENPDDNTGGEAPNPDDTVGGGTGDNNGNENGTGTTPSPTEGDIVGNLPEGTWKE